MIDNFGGGRGFGRSDLIAERQGLSGPNRVSARRASEVEWDDARADSAGGLIAIHVDTFEAQERDLRGQTATEAGQASANAHHAVTRDHDGDGIGADGLTDGPREARPSHRVRELTVRDHVSVIHGEQPLVDLPLEVRGDPGEVQLEIEARALPGEVLMQLVEGTAKQRRDVAVFIKMVTGR